MVLPPDYGKTLDAFRTGKQDFLEQQKRDLLKEAGGLAAAGNMAGARNKLYSGGDFAQAQNVSGEMRAQSAEARAIQAHARSLDDANLAKFAKSQELLGNMGTAILKSSNPQAALEQAKSILGQRGLKVENITLDQLPMLMQQNISAQQALQNEMQERQFKAEESRTQFAQRHQDRVFDNTVQQQGQAQENADRTFSAGREDAAAMAQFRQLQTRLMQERVKAQAAKASAPKPLTEGQAKARGYLGEMESVEASLAPSLTEKGESPMSPSDQRIALSEYAPGEIQNMALNKQQKQYLQAAEQFISVLLYHRSGAQISESEFKRNFRIYFPQPGDDQRTLRLKSDARKRVMEGLRIQGNAIPENAANAPDAASADSGDDDFKILGVE